MPASRTGGAIGRRVVPTTFTAPGVWQLGEVESGRRAGIWPSADPYIAQTMLLLRMDGVNGSTAFTDASPTPKAVTAVGNAQISTAQSKFGGASLLLDGNGDYLSLPTSTDFAPGTGDFTVECWVRFASVPATNFAGFANTMSSLTSGNSTHWHFGYLAGSGLYLGQHGNATYAYASWTPVANTWYAVAAVRASGTVYLFINGVSQTVVNPTAFSAANFSSGANMVVGLIATPYYLNGYIDEFRLTKAARYLSNYTLLGGDPFFGSVVLLLLFDGNLTDSSSTPKTFTAVGNAQTSTLQTKFGSGSLLLDGNADRIDSASDAAWALGTGDFTVEMFVRFASAPTVQHTFVNVAASGGFSLYINGSSGSFFSIPANTLVLSNRSTNQFTASWAPSANVWYHLAVTRSGGSIRAFVDGTQIGSTVTGNATNYAQGALNIGGSSQDGAAWTLNGNIDELRITKGAGTARYISNFTPPTTQFPTSL